MKFSEIWLREWIENLSISSNKLYDQLSLAGFQVEESNPIYNYKFHGVVIGKIVTYKIHPCLKDTLIITIDNGSKSLITVLCNSITNCRQNLRIVVATIGALLPDGDKIDLTFMKEHQSEGVLCTYSMLKLNNYTKNIIELPDDAPVGVNFYDYLNLNDNIININITPNRADCYSIIGLSREISIINRLKLKEIKINTIIPTIDNHLSIINEVPKQCPQFLGRVLKNVNVTIPTPLKIQEKLNRCGIRPINVVKDIINYVLLELGYPIFVFDYDKINQNIIYIRHSKPGETLTLSENNINLKLFENTLVIADHYKPLAIAGIGIGDQCSISIETNNIFLQSAFFDPSTILKQSKLYNLQNFLSNRYIQGIDLNLSILALNYVTFLLLKICSGKTGPIISIINDYFFPKSRLIMLYRSKLNKILGFHIKDQEIILILKSIGCQIIDTYHNSWKVSPPTWRIDIFIEEDLISEIIRIYGYSKIPLTSLINSSLITPNTRQSVTVSSLSRIKTILVDRGYNEIITYSFVNPNIQKLLHSQYTPLTLINPISSDMSVMRLSLWTGLIKAVIHNQNRQQKHIQLFESGICFIAKNTNYHQISQKLMISGIRSGLRFHEHWDSIMSTVDFYDIKGDVEAILHVITKKRNNNIMFKNCQHAALHPKKSAAIYIDETCIGYVGMIHPMIQNQLGLYLDTAIFELSCDELFKYKSPIKIIDIFKFPKNYRDISLIVSNDVSLGDIVNVCKKMNIEQLIDIKLIDVYKGDNIPKDHKSLTIKLTLQGKTHTLREEEITKIINKCIIFLKKNFHVVIR